jgi:hypothetical protein
MISRQETQVMMLKDQVAVVTGGGRPGHRCRLPPRLLPKPAPSWSWLISMGALAEKTAQALAAFQHRTLVIAVDA